MYNRTMAYTQLEKDEDEAQVMLNTGRSLSDEARPKKSLMSWMKYFWLLWNAILLLAVVVLGMQLMRSKQPDGSCEVEVGGRVDEWKPRILRKGFIHDSKYANEGMFSSLATFETILRDWLALTTPSHGIVKLNQTESLDMDPPYTLDPLHDGPQEAYLMSGPYQLQCLSTIMYSYAKLWNGGDEKDQEAKIAECFDYLRQGIMCAGDVTVEGNSSHRHPGVTMPWGTTHQCRDWRQVMGWANDRMVWDFQDSMETP